MSSNKSISPYNGDLQDRLRNLSIRANCPTRQENGQRYLGPPINWTSKPPRDSEVFISKLPADCFEDEIYDFCSQAGDIYLIRLMINFENENRGFCFVTFSCPQQAATAVTLLPQKPLRRGHFIHAEISMNNCTLKMYGLDYRFDDVTLENEIRMNTKDVVNVTIKRNTTQRSLMATLYFDTHQKAAIARRKLSQIANSRWGQNVKVFLWSKKLQNKQANHKDNGEVKNKENEKFFDSCDENRSPRRVLADIDVNSRENEKNDIMILKRETGMKSDLYSWMTYSSPFELRNSHRKEEILPNDGDYNSPDYSFSSPERSFDSISNYSTVDSFEDAFFSSLSPTLGYDPFSPSKHHFDEPSKQEHNLLSPPVSDDTLTKNVGSTAWDSDLLIQRNQWITSPTKSERDLFDFDSSFDLSPQKPSGPAIGYSPGQIELILNEASQVLGNFRLNDYA